jgi:16S rRNA (guanine527-N7)-methyltransferase
MGVGGVGGAGGGRSVTFEGAREPLARATSGLDGAARGAVETWIRLLCEWNARIDLTAARSGPELVDLMLADAMILAPRIAKGARVVDVGTGAGAPGLAIALARPDVAVTLCEPLAKRTSFLRTVLGTVGRSDVRIERARGEDLVGTDAAAKGTWDVALSRATLAPAEWARLGARLAKDTWVLLAKEEPPAIDGARAVDDVSYEWPETRAQRRAIRYERVTSR